MTAVRITVLKRSLHEDLAKAYAAGPVAPCAMMEEGRSFIAGFLKPEGYCDWAWGDLGRPVTGLLTGGSFGRGPFAGWMRDDSTMVSCCSDGLRPVSFLLERIDTKELLDLSSAPDPAPRDAYDSERWGEFSYSFEGLEASQTYALRLHFAEVFFSRAGQRIFAVRANGLPLLEGFDVAAEAGGP